MELKSALFATKEKTIPHAAGDLTIQRKGSTTFASKTRVSEKNEPKLNKALVSAAYIIDGTMAVGRCEATTYGYGIYTEIKKDKKIYCSFFSKTHKKLYFSTFDADTRDLLPQPDYVDSESFGALVAFCVEENSEANENFKRLLEEYRKTTAFSTSQPLYTLSDNIYCYVNQNNVEGDALDIDALGEADDISSWLNKDGTSGTYTMLLEYGTVTAPAVAGASSSGPRAMSTFMQHCYDGDYIVDLPWTEEQRERIPSRECLTYFVYSPKFEKTVKKFNTILSFVSDRKRLGEDDKTIMSALGRKQHVLNELLFGPPGTGKSFTVQALGAALGMPVYTVNGSAHMEEGAIAGEYGYSGGVIKFVPPTVLKVIRDGGMLEFAELNLLDPAVTEKLNSVLESPFALDTSDPDEPIVYRNPMAAIIGTLNVGLAGCKPQNAAFISRFHKFELTAPTNKQFEDMVMENTGCDRKLASSMLNLFQILQRQLDEAGEERIQLSMRDVYRTIIQHLDFGDTVYEAACDAFGSTFKLLGDSEMADDIIQNVIRAVLE